MHPFATDSPERKTVTVALAFLSVVLTYGLSALLAMVSKRIPWLELSAPSALALFGGLYWLFRSHIWKWSLLRKLRIVRVPNLNGTWKGTLQTSHDAHTREHPIDLRIEQDWTRINVRLIAERSSSHSITAALQTDGSHGTSLIYVYQNDPRSDASQTMQIHKGTTILHLEDDTLAGEYFTGRGRSTHGRITVERAEK